MEWVWTIYRPYVYKQLERGGESEPADEALEEMFATALAESTVTVLVQMPWKNSVRFKGLARYDPTNMFDLLNEPEEFLRSRYGGGKFKLNFHRGWHFVATQNFKTEGEPLWRDLPEYKF